MKLTPQSVTEAIASVETSIGESFIPTRWTNHTYAYDYLRSHAGAFGMPTADLFSRAEASGWLNDNLADPTTKDEVCDLLALAYLKEWNVAAIFCEFCDQPLVRNTASDTWITAYGAASCSSRDSVPNGRLHQVA